MRRSASMSYLSSGSVTSSDILPDTLSFLVYIYSLYLPSLEYRLSLELKLN